MPKHRFLIKPRLFARIARIPTPETGGTIGEAMMSGAGLILQRALRISSSKPHGRAAQHSTPVDANAIAAGACP
jgi:hypothetical protein